MYAAHVHCLGCYELVQTKMWEGICFKTLLVVGKKIILVLQQSSWASGMLEGMMGLLRTSCRLIDAMLSPLMAMLSPPDPHLHRYGLKELSPPRPIT